jgi:hypothetical protein
MNSRVLKLIVILLLVSILIVYFYQNIPNVSNEIENANNFVEFSIIPEYEEYLINQSVWVNLQIKNNTSDTYYIKDELSWDIIDFYIFDPRGDRLRRVAEIDNLPSFDSIALQPEEIFDKLLNLDAHFMSAQNVLNELEGDYKIYAFYQNLESNKIILKFNRPTGNDLKVYNMTYYGYLLPENEEEFLELKSLVFSNPQSKYAPQLYNCLFLSSYYMKNDRIYTEVLDHFLNHNPSNFGLSHVLQSYDIIVQTKNIISLSEFNDKLEQIKSRGEKAEFVVNQLQQLKNIKK